MFMIEDMGVEAFRETVVSYVQKIDPSFTPIPAAPAYTEAYERRDIVGVHPQKQEGKSWVCLTTPAGRLTAEEVRGLEGLGKWARGGEGGGVFCLHVYLLFGLVLLVGILDRFECWNGHHVMNVCVAVIMHSGYFPRVNDV